MYIYIYLYIYNVTWGSVWLNHCDGGLGSSGGDLGAFSLRRRAAIGVHAACGGPPAHVIGAVEGHLCDRPGAVVLEDLEVVIHVHARCQRGGQEVA